MKKNTKPIIILAVVILLVIGGFSAISMYNYQNVSEIEVSASPFGIQWGADKESVEKTMAAQGYEIKESEKNNLYRMTYILSDYQGIEGANGYAVFAFDESLKFTELYLQFTTADYANGLCDTNTVDMLYKSFRKSLNKNYEKMPYNSLEGYEYWKGENIFTTLYYKPSAAVIVLYTQNDTIAERAEELLNSDN